MSKTVKQISTLKEQLVDKINEVVGYTYYAITM